MSWEPIDCSAELAALAERSLPDLGTGLDAAGWEASVWVLHAMYEVDETPRDETETYDDLHRAWLREGAPRRTDIETILDERTINTGVPMGFIGDPGVGWRRLLWRELADRLGLRLGNEKFPPCFRWFPYRSWPATIQPPPEGSLDAESLAALAVHLSSQSPGEFCTASYAPATNGWDESSDRCFRGRPDALGSLLDGQTFRLGTPSNIWPEDASWFVYSDWDLWATKVSGPSGLIDRLIGDSVLETLDWQAP